MNKEKIIFYVSTGLISAMMLMSAFMYFSKGQEMMDSLKAIGIPYFFVQFLGVAKILGVVALWVSGYPTLKEWAYAGFTFTFLGATWIHFATSTPFFPPLIALAILGTSYYYRNSVSSQ